MARPIKTGLDYFPLDIRNDDKLDLIEAEFGITGFGIVIKLYRKIYENCYFYEWEEDQLLLFKKRINVDINVINDVINACFRRNIFDKKMFDNFKILTSSGIQKRFIQAVKSSRRSQVIFEEKYLCKGINDYINEINSEFITVNSYTGTQSKVKERKREYIKENLLSIFNRWLKYKKDKKQSYKNEDSIEMAYNKLYKLSEGDSKKAIEIIEQSLANNWDGLFALKGKSQIDGAARYKAELKAEIERKKHENS